MTESELRTRELEFLEKTLKIANLQVDTVLKEKQSRFLPWQFAVTAFSAGAAVMGFFFAIVRWKTGL